MIRAVLTIGHCRFVTTMGETTSDFPLWEAQYDLFVPLVKKVGSSKPRCRRKIIKPTQLLTSTFNDHFSPDSSDD